MEGQPRQSASCTRENNFLTLGFVVGEKSMVIELVGTVRLEYSANYKASSW